MTKASRKPRGGRPSQKLAPATMGTAINAAMADNEPGGPWMTGAAFFSLLVDGKRPKMAELRNLVTPESLPAWGDFTEARALLADCGIMTRAESPAEGIAYVKFVPTQGQNMIGTGHTDTDIMVRAVATLQFRPETQQWHVHSLGGYLRPEDLPPVRG
jgi:hypothetical protein